jgi:hypothetical protein
MCIKDLNSNKHEVLAHRRFTAVMCYAQTLFRVYTLWTPP